MPKHYHRPGLSHHERVEATEMTPTPNGCMEWPKARDPHGYGRVGGYQTKHIMFAHRAALELKLGRPIREGKWALHTCDNPPCCNPDHLYEGTQKKNVEDATKRDRVAFGERHWNKRLTEDDVRQIRAWEGKISKREMGRRLGVSDNTIRDVVMGRTWRRVE